MNNISKNRLWLIFKILIACISLIVIFNELSHKDHLHLLLEQWKSINQPGKVFLFISILVLMLLNWSIESLKWKILIRDFAPVPFIQSFRATLSGVTISLFTPNRMGEFIGRIMHLEPHQRIQSALVTIIGSFAQLIVTVVAGNIAVMFCLDDFFEFTPLVTSCIRTVLIVSSIGVVLLYFKVQYFERLILKWKWTQRLKKYLDAYEHVDTRELSVVLALSLLRYFIYVSQFVMVMILFGLNFGVMKMYYAIMLTLYGITVVPTIALSEPAVRASIAGKILGVYDDNTEVIMLASVALWLINLVVPAVIGSFTLLYIKLKNK